MYIEWGPANPPALKKPPILFRLLVRLSSRYPDRFLLYTHPGPIQLHPCIMFLQNGKLLIHLSHTFTPIPRSLPNRKTMSFASKLTESVNAQLKDLSPAQTLGLGVVAGLGLVYSYNKCSALMTPAPKKDFSTSLFEHSNTDIPLYLQKHLYARVSQRQSLSCPNPTHEHSKVLQIWSKFHPIFTQIVIKQNQASQRACVRTVPTCPLRSRPCPPVDCCQGWGAL